MTVTATSSMARAIASAISLVAASSTFQTRVGAGNATAALASIYAYELYEPAENVADEDQAALRPCAVIDFGENFEWIALAQGCSSISLDCSGQILVIIEDNAAKKWVNADSTDDYNDSFLDFLNYCGGVMDDMSGKLNNGSEDTFGFSGVSMLAPPMRTPHEERTSVNDQWFAFFGLTREGYGR